MKTKTVYVSERGNIFDDEKDALIDDIEDQITEFLDEIPYDDPFEPPSIKDYAKYIFENRGQFILLLQEANKSLFKFNV